MNPDPSFLQYVAPAAPHVPDPGTHVTHPRFGAQTLPVDAQSVPADAGALHACAIEPSQTISVPKQPNPPVPPVPPSPDELELCVDEPPPPVVPVLPSPPHDVPNIESPAAKAIVP